MHRQVLILNNFLKESFGYEEASAKQEQIFHEELDRSSSQHVFYDCPRKTGKSTVLTFLILEKAINPSVDGVNFLVVCQSLKSATDLAEKFEKTLHSEVEYKRNGNDFSLTEEERIVKFVSFHRLGKNDNEMEEADYVFFDEFPFYYNSIIFHSKDEGITCIGTVSSDMNKEIFLDSLKERKIEYIKI